MLMFVFFDKLLLNLNCFNLSLLLITLFQKNPNPRFFTRLIQCLDNKEYTWMLKYVPGSRGNEFEVTFTDRKNKKVWKKEDIALFVVRINFLYCIKLTILDYLPKHDLSFI